MANWLQDTVKAWMAVGLSLVVLGASNVAFAQNVTPPEADTATEAATVDVGWHPGIEFVSHVAVGRTIRYPTDSNDPQLEMSPAGILLTARNGMARMGFTADLGAVVLFGERSHLGVVAGVVLDLDAPFRMELLAEGGMTHYRALGEGLFVTQVSGDDSVTLPYVGGRASFAWRFGGNRGWALGLFAGVQADVGQQTAHPDVTSCFFGCSTSRETVTVGGTTFMTGLRVGFAP